MADRSMVEVLERLMVWYSGLGGGGGGVSLSSSCSCDVLRGCCGGKEWGGKEGGEEVVGGGGWCSCWFWSRERWGAISLSDRGWSR